MLQRGPCARKDPKPPETRWIEVVQASKGDKRENPLSGRLASRNTKGKQKEGERDTCDPATIIVGGVERRFSIRNGSGTTPSKGRSNGKILGLSTTVYGRWVVVVVGDGPSSISIVFRCLATLLCSPMAAGCRGSTFDHESGDGAST